MRAGGSAWGVGWSAGAGMARQRCRGVRARCADLPSHLTVVWDHGCATAAPISAGCQLCRCSLEATRGRARPASLPASPRCLASSAWATRQTSPHLASIRRVPGQTQAQAEERCNARCCARAGLCACLPPALCTKQCLVPQPPLAQWHLLQLLTAILTGLAVGGMRNGFTATDLRQRLPWAGVGCLASEGAHPLHTRRLVRPCAVQ